MTATCPMPKSTSGCPVDHAALAAGAPQEGCPLSAQALEFDPFGEAYQADPPEYVRWARDKEPLFFSPRLGYWVVTRFDDVKAIFRDNVTFSPSIALEKITPTGEEANAVLASYGYAMGRTLVNEDEPAHMPRRRALMDPFTPAALAHHEPMVRKLAREFVDRFIDDGKADLVDQMLWEVPLTVALHFLGVPEEDMGTLRKYSIAHTVNTWGRPNPDEQVAVAHAVGNFWQFAGKVLDKMRENPQADGWMQYGIRKQMEQPGVVTDSYLHSMMMAGIVAAHETTANATANAMKLLLQHPQAWREICEDPTLIPNAVEECLRHNGSVAAWRRRVTQDTVVGGTAIPAGSKLLIVTSSANRDDRHFRDADFFDIRRENATDHLTFGYGSHQCMGKNLARMEMQIFLEEFTRRLPHMHLADQKFSYVPNTSFRGPEHVWVEWDPSQNPERDNPEVLKAKSPVRLGESSRKVGARPVLVESIDKVANGVMKLRLVSVDGKKLPEWTPGAHIDVECGDTGITRQYSLCGDPSDEHAYEIGVLLGSESRGGSAWIHQHVKGGQTLRIRGPRNHFRLDEDRKKLIFIAGGIGITPISAMARRAAQLGIPYELHYSGRARVSMAFLNELSALHGSRLRTYADSEGQFNDLQAMLLEPQADVQVYACGPSRMLDALEQSTAHWPEDSLRIERFGALGKSQQAEDHAFEVELKDSGLVLPVAAGQTLLNALRAANIDVQSDCEEGLCGSCEVRVLAGKVDHRDAVLTRSERDSNTRMMTCCSRAADKRIVIQL